MQLVQRTKNIYEISMGYVKAFLIKGNEDLVLIDTGIPGQEDKILQSIEKGGLDSSKLKHILLTHLHIDHVGSLWALKNRTGAHVYAHSEEADAIEDGVIMRPCIPAPTLISRIMVSLVIQKDSDKKITGTKVNTRVNHGDILDIGGGIRVIHTPGHTKGHVSYLIEDDEKVLIAGDAASGGKHPGYPMLFEDGREGIKSLEMLGQMDFEMAFFAHGRGISSNGSKAFRKRF